MPKEKTKSQLSDAIPNQGPGLFFIDSRARVSAAKAYKSVKKFLNSDDCKKASISWVSVRPHLKPDIRNISGWYWSNADYQERIKYGDMKADARRLLKQLTQIEKTLIHLPRPIKIAVNVKAECALGQHVKYEDHISRMKSCIRVLKLGCEDIVTRNNKKKERISVERAVSGLWDLWEQLSGRAFNRTWDISSTSEKLVAERGPKEFTSIDALFVQVVMRAIDVTVEVKQVRTALKRVASTKGKSG